MALALLSHTPQAHYSHLRTPWHGEAGQTGVQEGKLMNPQPISAQLGIEHEPLDTI